MALSGLEDISFSRKEVKESRDGSIHTTKTLILKHQANVGDVLIDAAALNAPADALLNGFVQDSTLSLNLLINKKNLKIHSSRGLWLQMHEDFLVTSVSTIQLIGNIAATGGAEQDEVFTIYATPIQANAVITTDHKKQWQEYTLLDGETTLDLGREFEVRNTSTSQIGAIRVWRTGYNTPLLRNVANATASPSADGDYQEIDVGGVGISLEFNIAPNGQDEKVIIEFGMEYAGDFSMNGDIQSLYGAVLKLADDVKELGPYDITRYLTANPSDVERRAFGDSVQLLIDKMAVIENYPKASVYITATTAAAAQHQPIIFSTKYYDTRNAFSTITGKFTCPEDGYYRVGAVHLYGSVIAQFAVYKNAVIIGGIGAGNNGNTGVIHSGGMLELFCQAGDLLHIGPVNPAGSALQFTVNAAYPVVSFSRFA